MSAHESHREAATTTTGATTPLHQFAETVAAAVLITALVTVMVGLTGSFVFNTDQMQVIWPLIAACAVFVAFSYLLRLQTQTGLFGEIGFIYLALALAYTIIPGVVFLVTDFRLPLIVGGFNYVDAPAQPAELGAHFWRLVLFITGVATGYLLVRGGRVTAKTAGDDFAQPKGWLIATWIGIVTACILIVTTVSAPVTIYVENYTRFDSLPGAVRRFVYVCLSLKSGGYFLLLALMFRNYRKYRLLIYVGVPTICVYESIYSFGSRIESLIILVASAGFYHYNVTQINLKKGAAYLLLLGLVFSGVGILRDANYNVADAQATVAQDGVQQTLEFSAVFNTSFHLYTEREHGTLPPRPWQMFFYELIQIIPFLNHTTYHPQYWYARNYFPEAEVPPQTMGVVAESAMWGGEWDLLVRSLINGALFAGLVRWYLRRRNEWIAMNVYMFCFATCVLTLKYSVLYQLIPLEHTLAPAVLLTWLLLRWQRGYEQSAMVR